MMGLDTARHTSSLSCAPAIARGGCVRALFLRLTYAAYPPTAPGLRIAAYPISTAPGLLLNCVSLLLYLQAARRASVHRDRPHLHPLRTGTPTYYLPRTVAVLTTYYSLLTTSRAHLLRAGIACPQQAAVTSRGGKPPTDNRTHTCAEGAARRLSERGRGAMFCIELVSMVASSNDVEVHMINE